MLATSWGRRDSDLMTANFSRSLSVELIGGYVEAVTSREQLPWCGGR